MFRSIQTKLVWMVAAISLLTVCFFEVVVYLSVHESYYGPVEEFIGGRAHAASTYYAAMPLSGDTATDAGNITFAFADDRLRLQVIDEKNVALADTGAAAGGVYEYTEVQTARRGASSLRVYGDDVSGERIMAYAAPILRDGKMVGCVRVSVLLKRVDGEIRRIMIQYVIIGGGILLFAIAAGALLSGTIVRPIRRVTSAAASLGGGDLSVRAEVSTKDEVGELGASFNRMAASLERMEQLKSEFISQVSHDLRTPLTNIIGWTVTLKNSGPEEHSTMEHGLDIVLSESERLSKMIEELLDFSRLQAGGYTLQKSRVDLSILCQEIVEMIKPRANRANVELRLQGEEGVVVSADANRIKQILLNLLDNALKHTPAGGEITVLCRHGGADGVVTVTDTGEGIAPEVLPHVKELFYGSGAGLGLAICDRLVKLHGGDLVIESQVPGGTRAILKLPGTI